MFAFSMLKNQLPMKTNAVDRTWHDYQDKPIIQSDPQRFYHTRWKEINDLTGTSGIPIRIMTKAMVLIISKVASLFP